MKRWSRLPSLGGLVLVAAMTATVSPVIASAAASQSAVAPRNELTFVAPAGAHIASSTSTSPAVSQTGSRIIWTAGATEVRLAAFEGEQFKIGTFPIGIASGSLNLFVAGNSTSCSNTDVSRVTIHDVAYAGTELTSLAATVQANCGGTGQTVAEVRLNSTVAAVRAGSLRLGQDAPARTVTFTAPRAATVSDTAWAGDLSTDVTQDNCRGVSLAEGATCTMTVVLRPLQAGAQYMGLTIREADGAILDTVSITALGTETSEGAYTALPTPRRIIDTRTNNTPLRGGVTRDVQVTGANGIPSTGVSAVVLNITVVSPTVNGNLTAYPAGHTPPKASSVNFNRGWTGANLVTVKPGAGTVSGKVRLLTSGGTTHVIVDVVGYYRSAAGWSTTPGAFGSFHPADPYRLYDSRQDVKVNGYEIFDLVTDYGSEGNQSIKALAINVTAVSPEGAGHLTVWNGLNSDSVPNTSTLNFTTGRTVPNMTIVPVSRCWDCAGSGPVAFTIANMSSRRVHVIVDVVGVIDDNTFDYGSRLRPLATPQRVLDSRYGQGFTTIGPQAMKTGSASAVSTDWTTAVSGNLTAAAPTAATALTIWNADLVRPGVSSMNPYAGQYVSNMVMPGLSEDFRYSVHNGGNGNANVILDVVGSFEYYRSADYAPETGVIPVATGLAASPPDEVGAQPSGDAVLAPLHDASSKAAASTAPSSKVHSR